jgi:hypothetical protein
MWDKSALSNSEENPTSSEYFHKNVRHKMQ